MKEYGCKIYLFSVSFPQKVICISCDPAFHCEDAEISSFIWTFQRKKTLKKSEINGIKMGKVPNLSLDLLFIY